MEAPGFIPGVQNPQHKVGGFQSMVNRVSILAGFCAAGLLDFAAMLFGFQPPYFLSIGNMRLFAGLGGRQHLAQQLNQSFGRRLTVGQLRAMLLAGDLHSAEAVHPPAEHPPDTILVKLAQSRAVLEIKRNRRAGAHLVDILPARRAAAGKRHHQVIIPNDNPISDFQLIFGHFPW